MTTPPLNNGPQYSSVRGSPRVQQIPAMAPRQCERHDMVAKTAEAQQDMTYLWTIEQAQALVGCRRNRPSSIMHVVAFQIKSAPASETIFALAWDESQVSFDSSKVEISRTSNG